MRRLSAAARGTVRMMDECVTFATVLDNETRQWLGTYRGQPTSIGLRAEDIGEEARDAGFLIADKIASLPPVGSDPFIGVRCANEPMFFCIGTERTSTLGERVSISLNRRRIHPFDQVSGTNLRGFA
ncbi:MAG TPA: hypothetical protein VL598_06160 [Trinickia sp.]|uniref:hypothetical protein n=1 Tax=Trinickia sp. TaxID=2571163 RepID=UPI002B86CE48|nr:hypothetical protein [Trinickia sp.]HTI17230.1 hypothetical protein [Trinickia sp.]